MRRPVPPILIAASLAAMALVGVCSGVAPGSARAQGTAPAPKLGFPLACTLGRDCWIQHYVDRDPGGPARDYRCGSLTYHQHNGTDIRIPDMVAEHAGVNVLAAADGRVLRSRDGVADISVRVTGLAAVEGTECGNGMVIQHAGGLETQYCHMAKGSLVVKPGDVVKEGQPLGHVGLSGETEFPHLHLTVRQDGVVVDPFAPGPGASGTCGSGASLWRQTAPYTPRAVISAGFSPEPVTNLEIEAGGVAKPGGAAPYIVAYVRAIGLRVGDQPSLVLSGPGGETLAPSPPSTLSRDEDEPFTFVGKRRPAQGWPRGVYRARYMVRAAGQVVLQKDFETTINP